MGSTNTKNGFYHVSNTKKGILTITFGYKNDDTGKSIEAGIAPKEGSNLYSFKYNGTDFFYNSRKLPLADFVQGNPVLFPFPNRIENATYTWNGKTYLQKKDGIPVQLHSLVYDDRSWEYEEPVISEDQIALTTYIDIKKGSELYRGYPFECRLTLKYIINEKGLIMEYKVKNEGSEIMPFGFALHPYFRALDGDDDTMLTVPANKYYEIDEETDKVFLNKFMGGYKLMPNVMPTGKVLEVEEGKTDLRDETSIGSVFLDHVYTDIIKGQHPCVNYRKSKVKLNMICSGDIKHYVVYVPDGEPFICLEPQTCSTNAVNLYNMGIKGVNLLTLAENETHEGKIEFIPQEY